MTIEQAIKKSIEGGWDDTPGSSEEPCLVCGGVVFLDPLFWQSLGRALDWREYRFGSEACGRLNNPDYMIHWHRFIDHPAKGKNAESFFQELSQVTCVDLAD